MSLSYSRQHRKEQDAKARGESLAEDRSLVLLPASRKKWVDHPLGAWVVENTAVWSIVLVTLSVFGRLFSRAPAYLQPIALGFGADRMLMLVHTIVVNHVYEHVPYFAPETRKAVEPAPALISEHVWLTGLSQLVLALPQALTSGSPPSRRSWSLLQDLRQFKFFQFSAKLAVARCGTDLLFWLGHYLIHRRGAYKLIHKRHHEHKNPSNWTNQHFTVADFVVEALVPTAGSIALLKAAGVKMSRLEVALLVMYVDWLESCSHSGKPIPASTLVAPIAPVYQAFLGDLDRRNVEFHQCHHEMLYCNYSITQWPDNLFGTTRWNGSPPR